MFYQHFVLGGYDLPTIAPVVATVKAGGEGTDRYRLQLRNRSLSGYLEGLLEVLGFDIERRAG